MMSHDADRTGTSLTLGAPARPRRGAVLYPAEYVSLFVLGTLDLIITGIALSLGGHELNPIANRVLELAGFGGMVAFKFALLLLVVLICEYIGRKRLRTGRRLARVAVAITALPIVAALGQFAFIMSWQTSWLR